MKAHVLGACRHESKTATIMVRILVGGVRQRGGGGKRMVAEIPTFPQRKTICSGVYKKTDGSTAS